MGVESQSQRKSIRKSKLTKVNLERDAPDHARLRTRLERLLLPAAGAPGCKVDLLSRTFLSPVNAAVMSARWYGSMKIANSAADVS